MGGICRNRETYVFELSIFGGQICRQALFLYKNAEIVFARKLAVIQFVLFGLGRKG